MLLALLLLLLLPPFLSVLPLLPSLLVASLLLLLRCAWRTSVGALGPQVERRFRFPTPNSVLPGKHLQHGKSASCGAGSDKVPWRSTLAPSLTCTAIALWFASPSRPHQRRSNLV